MQKKLIVLAVAAALTAPTLALADNANVTVYGSAKISLDSNSGNANATAAAGTKNGLNLTSNSSKLGVKGAEDIGGGMKVVYQYETEVAAVGNTGLFTAQRDTYAGVAGDFGTVVAGRLPLANQYANDANFFGDKVGDAGNMTAGGLGGLGLVAVPSRVSRAIGYISPSIGGVKVTVGFVPNTPQSLGNTTQANVAKASSYTLRAAYDQNGIFAALNYLNVGVAGVSLGNVPAVGTPAAVAGTLAAPAFSQDGAKATVTSLAGGYDFGIGKVRAQFVNTDLNQQAAFSVGAGSGAKQSVFTVGGQYNLSETSAIKAQVAQAGDATINGTTLANSGATLMALDYDYSLSKRTTLYAAYAKVNNKANSQFSATGYAHGGVGLSGFNNSPAALSLGMIHDF